MTDRRVRLLQRRAGSAFEWMFRYRETGRITVVQFPNAALAIFLATVVVGRATDEDSATGLAVRWTGTVALAWWAVGEVRSGVNPWRRFLGVVGCAAVMARTVSLLG